MKEIRNGYSFRLLSSFLQQGTFKVATEAHLQVGHTHEDVDAVFSLCASASKTSADLQTPRDIQRRLEEKLAPIFTKKGMPFSVEILGQATLRCFISTVLANAVRMATFVRTRSTRVFEEFSLQGHGKSKVLNFFESFGLLPNCIIQTLN